MSTPSDRFRRPLPPAPVECIDLAHSALPPDLDGFTILHVTDTHVRRLALGHAAWLRLRRALAWRDVDLVALTGDYMTRPGDEPAAARMLALAADAWRSRLGALGVFGNHDTSLLKRLVARIPKIEWLENRVVDLPGLRVVGGSFPEDLVGALLDARRPAPFTLCLTHYPTEILPAADLGLPLVLCGHTHGGQLRLSARFAPHTSSALPPTLASGVLRVGGTLGCVSRGLGEAFIGLRLNCPAQLPLYTLRRGSQPGGGPGWSRGVRQVVAW
jgi:predicted MPP superfamily phosphohydrolase